MLKELPKCMQTMKQWLLLFCNIGFIKFYPNPLKASLQKCFSVASLHRQCVHKIMEHAYVNELFALFAEYGWTVSFWWSRYRSESRMPSLQGKRKYNLGSQYWYLPFVRCVSSSCMWCSVFDRRADILKLVKNSRQQWTFLDINLVVF